METQDGGRSDELLIQAIAAGDDAARGELIGRYWNAISRFCRSYLNDEGLADDVTQETFAKLMPGGELPEGAVKPWFYKVARNRCLDILRRYQRSPTHHNRIRTGFDAAADTAGPGTRAARTERQELIRQIVESMPEEYRSVLMLKYFEGLSRSEMAETLGVSEQTIKGRLVRGSAFLKDELAKITGTGS